MAALVSDWPRDRYSFWQKFQSLIFYFALYFQYPYTLLLFICLCDLFLSCFFLGGGGGGVEGLLCTTLPAPRLFPIKPIWLNTKMHFNNPCRSNWWHYQNRPFQRIRIQIPRGMYDEEDDNFILKADSLSYKPPPYCFWNWKYLCATNTLDACMSCLI